MNADYGWFDNDNKVIIVTLEGDWTWGDYAIAVDGAHAMAKTVEHDVNLIMHFKSEIPKGNPLPHLRRSGATQPKNVRHTAFVTIGTRFVKVMTKVIVGNQDWVGPKYVWTIDEALAHFEALAEAEKDTHTQAET